MDAALFRQGFKKMTEEKFETNLMRMIAAELWFLVRMQASREMFGKGYLSLSLAEKASIDQLVVATIAADYGMVTPAWLQTQKVQQPMGFQAPAAQPAKTS